MVKVQYNQNTQDWEELPKGSEKGIYIDGYMKQNLDRAREVIQKDLDMIFLYDGYEGSGKSVKAMNDAYYCDPTLILDRITFTPKEFRTEILNAQQYEGIVYDEAYTGLSSRATMSLINRTLVSMLAEIRQKNLFVFIVMPTFFDLDKYVALWRSRALIHVYMENFNRGYFKFYNMERKKKLYVLGKKFYNYDKPKPNFRGRFTNFYPINEKEYRKKKRESLTAREQKRMDQEIIKQVEDELFERIMLLDEGKEKQIPHKTKMDILNMPSSTYFLKLKQWKEMKEFS